MMKRIYLLGALTAVLAVSCTPETKELDILKQPTSPTPQVSNPPVDLTKTFAVFTPNEKEESIFRDPTTKLIGATTFSFAPKFTKRPLKSGENINLKIEQEKVGYERTLPEGSFTIDKAETSSTASESFTVTLKPEALKTLDITQEYVLRFRLKITSTTPADLPAFTSNDDSVYRIKITFTEVSFPEGDNVEITEDAPIRLIEGSKYTFESNYASTHLNKIKDGSYSSNWWVDTRQEVYLTAKFTEETLVQGVIIAQKFGWDNKYVGGVDISASPDGVKYYAQGSYTYDKFRRKIYLKFKEPLKVKEIKLDNFKKYQNHYIDIYEVEFF